MGLLAATHQYTDRLGFLAPVSTDEDQLRGFRQALKQASFLEGENVSILYRSAENAAGDPVGAGIITGLAHPGGNVTGISVQITEQEGKRMELLKKLPCCPESDLAPRPPVRTAHKRSFTSDLNYFPAPIRWFGSQVAISGKTHRITIASIMQIT